MPTAVVEPPFCQICPAEESTDQTDETMVNLPAEKSEIQSLGEQSISDKENQEI